MARLAANFGRTRGAGGLYVAACAKRDRLGVERLAVRFPGRFGAGFGSGFLALFTRGRDRLCVSRSRRLGMMGLRYAPRKASQFTHGFTLSTGP